MIRRALVVALAATFVALGVGVAADPASNQITRWGDLCTGVTETVFHWSGATPGACSSSPNKIVLWSDFTGNVTHSGSPCGSGNPLPTWSALLSCRGTGTTLTSQSFSVGGITYTSSNNPSPPPNFICTSSGSTSATLTTPSNTVAPTSLATQLTWTPSSVAGGNGSIAVTLKNPSNATVSGPTTVPNGSTTPVTWSQAGAAAGAYTWSITVLGSQVCSTSSGIVSTGTRETASGTYSWYQ